MADRYWVGGTGNWDATTTHWSATSGGAGGASVPTSADDVFFDSASNATAYVVTLTTAPICRSVSVAGPAAGNVTIAGGIAWQIFGSMTLAATGVTWTNTSNITFAATTTGFTITTNGVSLTNAATLNGAGGGWTLGSAYTTSSAFTVAQGSFATANFNLTVPGGFNAQGALTRSLTLGSSAISCGTWNCLSATNLTVNAGTSTITVTAASGTFNGGGLTYYNVFKASNTVNIGDAGNTFNALTCNAAVSGTFPFQFAGNQTIGTLTVNGGATAVNRISIQTTTALIGTQVTLTVGSFVTNGNIDFRDINIAGAASPLTVATGGDCGNNTNITLATPKTVYWNFAAGGNYNGAVWALTSGGAASAANYPLPQDTIIIEDTGLNSGATVTINVSANIGTLNISSRTLPMTLALAATTPSIYNNLTLSSAVTVTSSTASLLFQGFSKTQTVTSAGATIDAGVTINNPSTTVTLADNLTLGTTKQTVLTQGTLNVNGKNFTTGTFSSNNSFARSVSYGGGTITVTGASWSTVGVNYTSSGSGTISMTSASSKTFAGGGFSYPTLNQGGAGALVITGANTFANMTNTVQPCTITFPASTTTTVSDFNVNGTAGNLVTLNSSTSGTRFTLLKV